MTVLSCCIVSKASETRPIMKYLRVSMWRHLVRRIHWRLLTLSSTTSPFEDLRTYDGCWEPK